MKTLLHFFAWSSFVRLQISSMPMPIKGHKTPQIAQLGGKIIDKLKMDVTLRCVYPIISRNVLPFTIFHKELYSHINLAASWGGGGSHGVASM